MFEQSGVEPQAERRVAFGVSIWWRSRSQRDGHRLRRIRKLIGDQSRQSRAVRRVPDIKRWKKSA